MIVLCFQYSDQESESEEEVVVVVALADLQMFIRSPAGHLSVNLTMMVELGS